MWQDTSQECYFKGHLFKLELVTVSHIKSFHDKKEIISTYPIFLWDSNKMKILSHDNSIKPSDHHIATLSMLIHFIWIATLLLGLIFQGDVQDMKDRAQRIFQYNLITQIIQILMQAYLASNLFYPSGSHNFSTLSYPYPYPCCNSTGMNTSTWSLS